MPDFKILIVDYDPRSALLLRETLERAGYAVEIAKDGVAGIEAFRRIRPAMAFVEAMLPKKHGFEVCQELKQSPEGKNTPIVIVSSVYKGRKYRTQAFHQHRCDEYLEKPIAPEKLLEVVQRFLQPGAAGASAAPSPAVPRPAPVAARSDNPAELEIMERLDEILPDLNAGDDGEAVVVSFDPGRSRPRQPERAATSTAALPTRAGTRSGGTRGGASRAAIDPTRVPDAIASTKTPQSAADPMRVPNSSPGVGPHVARKKIGWIWIALGVALIAGIALIFLLLPR